MIIEEALRRHWGYVSFRPHQREAIGAALQGRDSLVVLPTGGGKSICYQLPAAAGRGPVLVVSPLIALMDDQVAAAREAGLIADAFHSNIEAGHRSDAWKRLVSGETQLLYVSPERLLVGDILREVGPRLLLAAVDEAHCVSHWGHEFRPEYRRITEALDRYPRAVRMALTATATPPVREDIAERLGLRDPVRLIGHPDRPNLIYRAFPRNDQGAQVLRAVRGHGDAGGIVYAQTRREVERIAASLERQGVSCAAYHAGLDADVRRRVQDDFVNERLAVVVATIAFGMGIDRSNVRFVVHANTPRSIEHYQQESGRAGRDGLPAECTLLFSVADLVTHRALAHNDGSLSPERAQALERQLRGIGGYAVAPVCRHRLLTEHFGAPYPASPRPERNDRGCGACDVCLGETRRLSDDESLLTAKKVLSAAWRAEGRFGAGYVTRMLLGQTDERMAGNGHTALRVFGLLKDAGEPAVRWWIDQLVVQGFLVISEESGYPLLDITPEGRDLCRDRGVVSLGVPPEPRKKAPREKEKRARRASPAFALSPMGIGGGDASSLDEALFERLRELRRRLATEQGVPPYVVFHDTVLVDMATRRPTTEGAFRSIKGVGDRKWERYGTPFLDLLASSPSR
jgi:ATP-dependent DNA helicase RecQ